MSENSPKNMEEALKLIAQLQTEITQLHKENNNLREMLIKSRKMMFGKSSEQIKNIPGCEQLSFFNEAEQEYNSGAPEPKEDTVVQSYTDNDNIKYPLNDISDLYKLADILKARTLSLI